MKIHGVHRQQPFKAYGDLFGNQFNRTYRPMACSLTNATASPDRRRSFCENDGDSALSVPPGRFTSPALNALDA